MNNNSIYRLGRHMQLTINNISIYRSGRKIKLTVSNKSICRLGVELCTESVDQRNNQ